MLSDGQTYDEAELAACAVHLAKSCRSGDVILLRGDLGVGKSSFARAFIRSLLDARTEVPSPTFTLVQRYETERFTIFHYDLYRLETPGELIELALDESIEQGVCLIEWPDIAGDYLPENRLELTLDYVDDPLRRGLSLKGSNEWQARLNAL